MRHNIFAAIQNMLRVRGRQQRLRRSVAPEAIRAITAELRDLASRAAQFCHTENGTVTHFKTLEVELARLEDMANRPEFCKLSTKQRLELRQGLLHVRSQILITMQKEPSPTDFIQ